MDINTYIHTFIYMHIYIFISIYRLIYIYILKQLHVYINLVNPSWSSCRTLLKIDRLRAASPDMCSLLLFFYFYLQVLATSIKLNARLGM